MDAEDRPADDPAPVPGEAPASVSERARTALAAARAGAAVAVERFRTDLTIETKSDDTDVVTAADRDAQRRVLATLADAHPEEPVVAEESGARKTVPESGAAWAVDPIDGTHNYVRESRVWSTGVAALRDADPVAAAHVFPALGDAVVADRDGVYRNGEPVSVSDRADPAVCTVVPTLWWPRDRRREYASAARAILERFGDMRRPGCVHAVLADVAAGSLDGAITNVAGNPWDVLGGVRMVRAGGGRVTDLEGNRWRHDSRGLVASNGAVHEDVLAAAREIDVDTG